jgi:hypothetical protein
LGLIAPAGCWLLWPSVDEGQFPEARRWEGMGEAFTGFARAPGVRPAVVYDYGRALKLMRSAGFYRVHHPELDTVSAVEQLRHSLLNVWMGDRTPFLCSVSGDYGTVVADALRDLNA